MSHGSKPKLFISREIFKEVVEKLERYYDVEVWDRFTNPPPNVLRSKAKECHALLTMAGDKVTCDLLQESKNLRIVSQMIVGFDNVDVECATKLGVYVTNAPGIISEATADFTWALILSVARRVVEADNYVRWGEWERDKAPWHPLMFLGTLIYGKTLGIIGLGAIGKAVARRAKGFNMKVLYYDVVKYPEEVLKELNVEYRELDDLLKESDIITVHTPLTKDTYHLINEERLKNVKKGAILINAARGAVVDTEALIKALKEGKLAGAGLDVFESEPLPQNHPITMFKNVVLAPHIASATYESRLEMALTAAMNLIAFAEGKVPPNLVNRDVVKVRSPGF
ncbi:MAG: glyoxylate reductase [Sulfolobales archaeon]|nr:NAD(P)-binding domain-containing protein [Sulfolobales archaeon]MCX8186621.1 glyoxylate reductase [Sulfolobales archaeon]MDW7969916.1 glyoxylate reductase [Sulfolobales archaeon]